MQEKKKKNKKKKGIPRAPVGGWRGPVARTKPQSKKMCAEAILLFEDRIVNGRDSERVQREKKERERSIP